MEKKICNKCKIERDILRFRFNNGRYRAICKDCANIQTKNRELYKKQHGPSRINPIINGEKLCLVCKINKPLSEFPKNGKWSLNKCRKCKAKEKLNYVNKNREKVRKWKRDNYHKNKKLKRDPIVIIDGKKKCTKCKETKNLDCFEWKKKQNRYKAECKICYNNWRKSYRNQPKIKNNIQEKLNNRIRAKLKRILQDERKNSKMLKEVLQFSINQLKFHLESQFTEKLNWGNAQIDHVIPVEIFDFNSTGDEAFKLCWSLENLRPLTISDNSKKSDYLPCGIRARDTTLRIHNLADYNSVRQGGLPLAHF